MRTALFLLAGLLLLAAFTILARLFSQNLPGAQNVATVAFLVLWLAVTAGNMAVGVSMAGYPAREEWPVLALLFGVPALTAVLLHLKLG